MDTTRKGDARRRSGVYGACMARVLAALLALCVAVPAVALAADTDPKKRITAADQAKARSVLLRRTDFVAGWNLVPPKPDSDFTCPGFEPDASDLTLSGEAEANFEYGRGVPSVSSFSDVYASKTDAVAAWTRLFKPALVRCLAHVMHQGAKEAGATITIVKQGRMSFPRLSPRTAAYVFAGRMTVKVPGKPNVTLPFALHLVALGHGRGDAALMTFGFGTGIPRADLISFAKLTASRLAAAKL